MIMMMNSTKCSACCYYLRESEHKKVVCVSHTPLPEKGTRESSTRYNTMALTSLVRHASSYSFKTAAHSLAVPRGTMLGTAVPKYTLEYTSRD